MIVGGANVEHKYPETRDGNDIQRNTAENFALILPPTLGPLSHSAMIGATAESSSTVVVTTHSAAESSHRRDPVPSHLPPPQRSSQTVPKQHFLDQHVKNAAVSTFRRRISHLTHCGLVPFRICAERPLLFGALLHQLRVLLR